MALALDPVRRHEVLVIGPAARRLAPRLLAAGCTVAAADDLVSAVKVMLRSVCAVAVVAPDGGGVDFAVAATCGRVVWAWAAVPFVILPEPGDSEFVVYRGYDDFTSASTASIALEEVVADLLRSG